jgi:glycosyltransferase involved in cell wall biosynthesis
MNKHRNAEYRNPCCFINPFANHSYFTVRALTGAADVYIFCPPLQLQLLFGRWSSTDIPLCKLPLKARFISLLCTFTFFSYKVSLIDSSLYLKSFRYFLYLFLQCLRGCATFVFYQDYVADFLAIRFPSSLRICELIIATDISQSNYHSTVAAIQSSSVVVIPSPALARLVHPSDSVFILAPYGGNKSEFYSSHSLFSSPPQQASVTAGISYTSSPVFRIIARAHSFRKGADILLKALILLDDMLSSVPLVPLIDLYVCGLIMEPDIQSEFLRVTDRLQNSGTIRITSKQLDQSSFSQLLATSHLFVMPSRLESTSLAALEALWYGLPSILTPECGVDDFVSTRHGILLPDHEPSSLAEAIHDFCVFPEKLLSCRSFLTQDRLLFTWARYFTAYRQLFQGFYASES